jgi:hypothetical protein
MVMANESIKAALYARDYKLAVKHFFSCAEEKML